MFRRLWALRDPALHYLNRARRPHQHHPTWWTYCPIQPCALTITTRPPQRSAAPRSPKAYKVSPLLPHGENENQPSSHGRMDSPALSPRTPAESPQASYARRRRGRKHQAKGNGRRCAVSMQPPTDVCPVHARHGVVEQDDIGVQLPRQGQGIRRPLSAPPCGSAHAFDPSGGHGAPAG
jgi:hypothetical protein